MVIKHIYSIQKITPHQDTLLNFYSLNWKAVRVCPGDIINRRGICCHSISIVWGHSTFKRGVQQDTMRCSLNLFQCPIWEPQADLRLLPHLRMALLALFLPASFMCWDGDDCVCDLLWLQSLLGEAGACSFLDHGEHIWVLSAASGCCILEVWSLQILAYSVITVFP